MAKVRKYRRGLARVRTQRQDPKVRTRSIWINRKVTAFRKRLHASGIDPKDHEEQVTQYKRKLKNG